jgi:hypothetical protein
VFSCSKIEQKQLNTWVSFQSAEQPLLGQFSVSGNIQHTSCRPILCVSMRIYALQMGFNEALPRIASRRVSAHTNAYKRI